MPAMFSFGSCQLSKTNHHAHASRRPRTALQNQNRSSRWFFCQPQEASPSPASPIPFPEEGGRQRQQRGFGHLRRGDSNPGVCSVPANDLQGSSCQEGTQSTEGQKLSLRGVPRLLKLLFSSKARATSAEDGQSTKCNCSDRFFSAALCSQHVARLRSERQVRWHHFRCRQA